MSNLTPPNPPASNAIREPRTQLLVIAALGLVGSFAPWASVESFLGSISVSGSDADGQLTMILFAVVGILAFVGKSRGATIGSLVVSVLAALIAVIDIKDVSDTAGVVGDEAEGLLTASVGWGLWLVLAAAVAGVVANGLRLQSENRAG